MTVSCWPLAFGKKNNTPQHPQIFTDLIGLSRIICENPFSFVPISGCTDFYNRQPLESTLLRAMFLTQRHSHDPALLFLHLDTIAKNLPSGNPSEALVVYIFMLLKADYSKEQIIQQITPDMATTFKSFYDKLIEEGIERERLNTIYRMYNAKLNLEQIAVAVGLTMEEVKKILGLEGE